MYNIDSENFSGPLDLLLSLIQKNKLNICEVSLSKIADEFLEKVSFIKDEDVQVIGDFIYICSKLIEIKSRYLLNIKSDEDEETEFILSLEEYAKYKSLAKEIRTFYQNEYQHFEKVPDEFLIKEELDLSKVNLQNILNVLNEYKNENEQLEIKFTRKQKSLSQKIEYIQNYVQEKRLCFFDDIIVEDKKDEKVVSMLGILHLAKENIIDLNQENNFKEIFIKKR